MEQLITTRKYNKTNVSIPANGYVRLDIDITLSGYAPIGVLGWSGSSYQINEYVGRFSVAGNTLTFIVFNRGTSALTDSFGIDILYKKQF